MRVKVTVKMKQTKAILNAKGFGTRGKVQKFFTALCAKEMDKYVPMGQGQGSGILKNTKVVRKDSILYVQPYAHYQYIGKLYIDPVYKLGAFFNSEYGFWSRPGVKKIATNIDLKNTGAATRGPYWDKRMWKDRQRVIIRATANYAGGKPK